MHRICTYLLVALVVLVPDKVLAQLSVEDWCRARCNEVLNPEFDMPACKRFTTEYAVEDGKSVEKKVFIKECQEEFAEWGNRVARRQNIQDAFEGDKEGCVTWCKRVAKLRDGEPFSFNNVELWQILDDINLCSFGALFEMELSLFPMTINCRGMAFVPAGKFMMGCNEGQEKARKREIPMHLVYLDAYFIDKHEVTVAAYRKCVEGKVCSKPLNRNHLRYYNWGYDSRDNHPINGVDWRQADDYCGWTGKRLCSEAEWEKAARGTDGRKYPWGNDEPTARYTIIDSGLVDGEEKRPWPVLTYTWPVCSRPAGNSPYGLCDMAGNVWEWVADWYNEDYYRSGPGVNPKGPESGKLRSIRGGRFYRVGFFLSSCRRSFFESEDLFPYLGFRCCKSVQ